MISPPVLYVQLGHGVDLYAPGTHDVGQLVAIVPGQVYVLYALPLVHWEEEALSCSSQWHRACKNSWTGMHWPRRTWDS